jgi:hypothetical protein
MGRSEYFSSVTKVEFTGNANAHQIGGDDLYTQDITEAPGGAIRIAGHEADRPCTMEINVESRDMLRLIFKNAAEQEIWKRTLTDPAFFEAVQNYVSVVEAYSKAVRHGDGRLIDEADDKRREVHNVGAEVFEQFLAQDDSGKTLRMNSSPQLKLPRALFAMCAFSIGPG